MTPEIEHIILWVLAANGGKYVGTFRLCQKIPASTNGVLKSLQGCRRRRLIKSIHSHGGRGHHAIHRLTAKGHREALNLTEKGKDYVQSR